MIRPRGGDFLYSELEFAIMRRDIEIAKELGANGVVIGLLTEYGHIDIARTAELVSLARPLSVTFHRAFDMVADPVIALDALIELGIDRLLTSGLEPTGLEGAETIAALMQQAAGRIIIMPGGGINERNIAKIVRQTGAKEVHLSGRSAVESAMRYRNHRMVMGGTLHPPEFSQLIASADRISACLSAVQNSSHPS
jgi:copper homeostasis protein